MDRAACNKLLFLLLIIEHTLKTLRALTVLLWFVRLWVLYLATSASRWAPL